MNDSDLSPLMRQYYEIKQAYKEAILFFRVGDFYEMFFNDAEEASKILNIALTSRDKHSPNPVPLCGVPHHSANGYIAKLLQSGKNVALCEQVEDPKLAKGLIKREVVRLFTPGTLIDPELLESAQSNFLACVGEVDGARPAVRRIGLAVADLSTGEFWISEFSGIQAEIELLDEVTKIAPQELLYREGLSQNLASLLRGLKLPRIVSLTVKNPPSDSSFPLLCSLCSLSQADPLPFPNLPIGLEVGETILEYIRDTQPTLNHRHIQFPLFRQVNHEMQLDSMTIRNLELVSPLSGDPRSPTLFSILDHTLTAMGSRLLRQWIVRPLLEKDTIQSRLQAVSELTNQLTLRNNIRLGLKSIQDLERLSGRIALGAATPRELNGLKESLGELTSIEASLETTQSSFLQHILVKWDTLRDVFDLIERAILPTAPVAVRDGGVIKTGFDAQLDRLRQTTKDGMKWITDLESRERAASGIDSLKIKYNQVFGYYIEITKANLSRVPVHYSRKQTLANAERFTTDELKSLEEQVTNANIRLQELEIQLFSQVRQELATYVTRIQTLAKRLAQLDVICSMAEAAAINRYTYPEIHEGGTIEILEGRHPVLERMSIPGGFIPNDTHLNFDSHRLLIITGPNMAGKSTYLRQTALIVLMAQIGSFVPAGTSTIGLVDRIFTRVGASDNLVGGQSTFMMEMTETSKILKAATSRSLILLDEIGRGTSTFDGLSIAWAIGEYIQDRTILGARTLFATHYHEMSELETLRDGIKNFTVAVKENKDEIIFLRKIIQGKADRSYGIHVARLAGLPTPVIVRANEVLQQLERSNRKDSQSFSSPDLFPSATQSNQIDPTIPPPHPIIDEVKQMDLFSMTPIEALNRLADIQKRLGEP